MGALKRVVIWACSIVALGAAVLVLPLRWALLRTRKGKVRSLWTGKPIINMGINARAERLLGADARSLVFSTYYVSDEFDYDLSRFSRLPVVGKFLPFIVFPLVCIWADRLHFYCDQGVLHSPRAFEVNPIELPLYRLLGIEIFFWTYGADVRTRGRTQALGEPNCCTDCTLVGSACGCDDVKQQERYAYIRRYATSVFAMGDMLEYTPGSRNDLFFWPVDLHGTKSERYVPAFPGKKAGGPIRIVHAPNHRMFKGTRFLLEAVEKLRAEGAPIDLVLVERIPNEKALEIYRSADIIFDQCLVGFHGYFALEAMALGKPVVCFIRKPSEYLLAPEECPMISSQPGTLLRDLRELAANRERLHELGVRGRRYIERHFSLDAFAGRLQTAYRELGE